MGSVFGHSFVMQYNGVARTLKVTHIKARLLDQAMILFKYVPFQNENFALRKEFAHRGSKFFPIRAVPYGMINHYHIVCYCVIEATSK